MADNQLLPQVETEMAEIRMRVGRYEADTDRALDDLRVFSARARDLAKQLRSMKRKLRRNTKRFCNALDAVSRV